MKALWVLSGLALAACADMETKPWYRADGGALAPDQIEVDKATCRDEMQKTVAATNRAAGLDRGVARPDLYESCMARLGYTASKDQRAVAPPPGAPPPGSPPPGSPPPGPPATAQAGPRPGAVQPGVVRPGAAQSGSVQSGNAQPVAEPASECRKPTDLRMWLPPCS
jgi:hypothetical protein